MFCPKCGQQNPETGRFCRSCGTGLENVSAALTGVAPDTSSRSGRRRNRHDPSRRNDPNELYGEAVKAIISGVGFLIVAVVLFSTNVARGERWWWAMLFPAFFALSKGVSDLLKYRKMEATRAVAAPVAAGLSPLANAAELPPAQTQFVPADQSYKTGDLVPPSVTETTTRHLELDREGQTMTLPKK